MTLNRHKVQRVIRKGPCIGKSSKEGTMFVNKARQVLRERNLSARVLTKASTIYCAHNILVWWICGFFKNNNPCN